MKNDLNNSGDLCGLCGEATARDEEGIPYIICRSCFNRMLKVSPTYKRQLDELPFGVIDLDREATILAFNKTEAELAKLQAEKVIGRNFFTEVAPCTAVKEFEGRFQEFMHNDEQMMRFDFTFSFKDAPVAVDIFFLRVNAQRNLDTGEPHAARIIVKRITD